MHVCVKVFDSLSLDNQYRKGKQLTKTTTTTHAWCGIDFTTKEWEDSINGRCSLKITINNILESGLPMLEDLRAGKTLTTEENKIMRRIEQIVMAAKASGVVFAECNEKLLETFDYLAA